MTFRTNSRPLVEPFLPQLRMAMRMPRGAFSLPPWIFLAVFLASGTTAFFLGGTRYPEPGPDAAALALEQALSVAQGRSEAARRSFGAIAEVMLDPALAEERIAIEAFVSAPSAGR
jgi:hypothetical protein